MNNIKPLLDRVNIFRSSPVLDPCAGYGEIVVGLRESGFIQVDGNDISPQYEWDYCGDATTKDFWASLKSQPDWTITRPPFDRAHLILPLALECSRLGVAFILPMSFLRPTLLRGKLLKESSQSMSNLIFLNNRDKLSWIVWRFNKTQGCEVGFVQD